MKIRLTSLAVVVAMILSFGGFSAFAHDVSDVKTPVAEPSTSSKSATSAKDEARKNELRGDVLKLVNDAKAGRVVPRSGPQFPRSQRNNLSTGAKIGIAAAIAGAIVLIIVFHELSKD